MKSSHRHGVLLLLSVMPVSAPLSAVNQQDLTFGTLGLRRFPSAATSEDMGEGNEGLAKEKIAEWLGGVCAMSLCIAARVLKAVHSQGSHQYNRSAPSHQLFRFLGAEDSVWRSGE